MAGAVFKNVSPGVMLSRGDVVRLAFAQEHSYVARDASFSVDFGGLYDKLYGLEIPGFGKAVMPITRNATTRGMTTAVCDLRVILPVTAAAIVKAADDVSGFYVQVTSIEKLGAGDAARAAGNAGALQREAVRNLEEQEQDRASWWNQIASATGFTLSAMKWIAIALVVMYLISQAGTIKTVIGAVKRK